MEQKDTSERPPDSDFQQQNLKAWQPLLTPKWVIGTFLIIGFLFVPIGIFILRESDRVKFVEVYYSDTDTQIEMPITHDMEPPVYFYYKLENFYQNHRRYVKSRNDAQLRGEETSDLESCDPLLINPNQNNKKLYPCGLIAGSYFNDRYLSPVIVSENNTTTPLSWTDRGISWASDREVKFRFGTNSWQKHFDNKTMTRITPWLGTELPVEPTEDFIVWMRTAGLPTFKKLRYIINTKLNAGTTLRLAVDNHFNVTSFSGKKAAFLSTTSSLGGRNDFLGYAYIVVGALCILLALVFLVKHCVSPRPLGDMAYFNWNGASRVGRVD